MPNDHTSSEDAAKKVSASMSQTNATDATGEREPAMKTSASAVGPQIPDGDKTIPPKTDEIRITHEFSYHTAVSNGKAYPFCKPPVIRWTVADDVPQQHHFNVYRDGVLCFDTKKYSSIDANMVPNSWYHYKVAAVDQQGTEYAYGTHSFFSPGVEDRENLLTKLAVVPLRFKWNKDPNVPIEQLKQRVETNFNSLKTYLEEVSFGKIKFRPYYLDEVGLPAGAEIYCAVLSEDKLSGFDCDSMTHGVGVISQAGHKGKYDVFVSPVAGQHSGSMAGGDYLQFDPDDFSTGSLIHEVLHFLGLAHAGTWEVYSKSNVVGPSLKQLVLPGICKVTRYGDRFDPVGATQVDIFRHPSAYHKFVAGWIAPEQITTVTEKGTYQLAPIEAPGDGIAMIKIPFPDENRKVFYFLEYRAPIGFDAVPLQGAECAVIGGKLNPGDELRGIMIRLRYDTVSAGRAPKYDIDTFLLNTLITEENDFHDPYRNIKVKLVSWDDKQATVKISGKLAGN